jgi:hypothetical protein
MRYFIRSDAKYVVVVLLANCAVLIVTRSGVVWDLAFAVCKPLAGVYLRTVGSAPSINVSLGPIPFLVHCGLQYGVVRLVVRRALPHLRRRRRLIRRLWCRAYCYGVPHVVFIIGRTFYFTASGDILGFALFWPAWLLFFSGRCQLVLRRELRVRSARLMMQCSACGYSVRVATERCPECGIQIASNGSVRPGEA